MTQLIGTTESNEHRLSRERSVRRSWFAAGPASRNFASARQQDIAARWGAAAGILVGGLLAIAGGEPNWLAAPVLLGMLGWASGKFNTSFQRGSALARELAPALEHRNPVQR